MSCTHKRHTSATIYEILKKRIIAGFYAPGAHLREAPIAQEMGTSRTPVRTAFESLIGAGLAEQRKNRGVFVISWSKTDIEDMIRVRIQLEPYAARLTAQRSKPIVVENLKASNQAMQAAISEMSLGKDSREKIQQANQAFHQQLLIGSGSPRLIEMLGTLVEMPIIMRSFLLYEHEDFHRSFQHHKDILFAVENKDGELAELLMRVHLKISTQRFLKHRIKAVGP